MPELIDIIKKSEDDGFKTGGMPYKDHLGNDTIGYGTLLPLSEIECENILQNRLKIIIIDLFSSKIYGKSVLDIIAPISQFRKNILYEMAYQLGVPNLMTFRKMWKAIDNEDFNKASVEMIDSKWYSQTPNRARILAKKFQKGF